MGMRRMIWETEAVCSGVKGVDERGVVGSRGWESGDLGARTVGAKGGKGGWRRGGCA